MRCCRHADNMRKEGVELSRLGHNVRLVVLRQRAREVPGLLALAQ